MGKKVKKQGVPQKSLFKKAGLFLLSVFLLVLVSAASGFVYLMHKTVLGNSLYSRKIAQTSMIYDRTGEHLLYEIHGEEDRKILLHDQIPDTIRIATIATEDKTFYQNCGIEPLAILRALKTDIKTRSAQQGGSTITQQLARNVYLTREKTIKRKILEIIYAIKINKKYTKDQILDAYLNQVPYGSNAYGIESAAQTYFGKSAENLSLDEAAMLAALTKAPSYYSPYGDHTNELIYRQKNILRRIAVLYPQETSLVANSLTAQTAKKIVPFSQPIDAPHFVFYVRDQLEKKYGKDALEQGGLKIYTTLDYEKQKLAEKIIQENDSKLKKYGASNAALVAIDPKNGQILSMVGSKNYFDKSLDGQVNVTISPRQPGSSFKPIIYAKAFEKGFQPETLVLDAKTDFGPDGSGRDYVPKNYDGRFHGVLSMRQALAMSLNVPAIKTLREVGLNDALEMAHRLGITTLNDRNRYGLSLVIGGGEVTLLDETSAFSVFANDGKRNPVDPILKIIDSKGNIIDANTPQNLPALDPQTARKINSILSDNKARTPIFGPNNKLFIPGRVVAAKTGTTQEFRDAWTVGYTPNIAVGVWAGNNNNFPMHAGADGSFVAAPIWNQFMSEIIKSYPDENFLAYDKTESQPDPTDYELSNLEKKVTYFRISNGKEISRKKAKKLDPSKVRIEERYISTDNNENNTSLGNRKPVF